MDPEYAVIEAGKPLPLGLWPQASPADAQAWIAGHPQAQAPYIACWDAEANDWKPWEGEA